MRNGKIFALASSKPAAMLQTELRSPLLRRIDQLAHLQDSWNGEDSFAPDANIVRFAEELIQALPSEAWDVFQSLERDIYATAYGTIVIDWALDDGRVVASVEVSNQAYSGFAVLPDRESVDVEPFASPAALPEVYSRVFRHLASRKPYFAA